MGIKLLCNYPIKQFPGISIPDVELTFKGEFKQEKYDNKYILHGVCYFFIGINRDNSFDILPIDLECENCPTNPLTELYNHLKNTHLCDMQYEDN